MREGIIASCSGNSDACCCRLSRWRQVERDRAKTLASSALVSGTFVAVWKQPSGDINGTTHFRVEAGAVSGPPDSIHLSARQIGTFPVYSLHHVPHPARSLCSPSISLAALFPLPAPIKNPCACLGQAHPSDLSEGDFLWAFPTTDGYLAGLTQARTICYCKCLSDTFRLFALTARWWKTRTLYGKLWQFIVPKDQCHIREMGGGNEIVVKGYWIYNRSRWGMWWYVEIDDSTMRS